MIINNKHLSFKFSKMNSFEYVEIQNNDYMLNLHSHHLTDMKEKLIPRQVLKIKKNEISDNWLDMIGELYENYQS